MGGKTLKLKITAWGINTNCKIRWLPEGEQTLENILVWNSVK